MKVSKTKSCKILLGLIISISFFFNSNAQVLREQLIGSYVYNFGNKINWPDDNYKEFHIVLISSNNEIISELKKMSEKRRIQNKEIKLTILSKPNTDILTSQLIFIGKDKLSYYMSVFDMIEGKEILLVSDNFENKSYVMLNLYDSDGGKLLFEINKPNILNQKLELSDEILLMGGTEIDIASVYFKSQHSLRSMEKKLIAFNKTLDSLKQSIETRNKLIQQQNDQLALHEKEIEEQKAMAKEQLSKIEEYKSTIQVQLQRIEAEEVLLNGTKDSLRMHEKLLEERKKEISHNKLILMKQTAKIDSINEEINKSNQILNSKEIIIDKQRGRMNLLIIVLVFSVLLIVIVLYAYRQIRNKSVLLLKQKQQIDRINGELNENNEELKATLEDLKHMQEKLVQSEKMASLGVLSAGIAHEINNPINFVYAGINSLLRDFEDIGPVINEISKLNPNGEDLKDKLEYVKRLKEENYFDEAIEAIPEIIKDIKIGADRTAEIVKGLRSFSRIDKGEMKYADIHEGIDMTLILLKNNYKNHIQIVKNYDESLTKLKCYPGKMNQVFLNLLSNAIDAIPDKGTIWITTKKEENNAIIIVKDDGSGISKEAQVKLYDPFFTTKPVGQGIGLGLSISYGIIKEHNGEIKVNSKPGQGSEFLIILPLE